MRTHSPAFRFDKLHFPHQLALVLFVVLLLAVLFGCSRPPLPKTDAALTSQVKVALADDTALRRARIDVDANGGIVTLKGRVDNDDAKKRIQEIAEKVPGVTWVQNQISVVAPEG
jgi:hypothetical protein